MKLFPFPCLLVLLIIKFYRRSFPVYICNCSIICRCEIFIECSWYPKTVVLFPCFSVRSWLCLLVLRVLLHYLRFVLCSASFLGQEGFRLIPTLRCVTHIAQPYTSFPRLPVVRSGERVCPVVLTVEILQMIFVCVERAIIVEYFCDQYV